LVVEPNETFNVTLGAIGAVVAPASAASIITGAVGTAPSPTTTRVF